MVSQKSIAFFGTNETVNVTGVGINLDAFDLPQASFSRANVLIDFPTIAVSGGTLSVSVQERFSGLGYVETANATTRAIRPGQKLWLVNSSPGTLASLNASTIAQVGPFPLLGTGGADKRVVFTQNSVITEIFADVYFVFTN